MQPEPSSLIDFFAYVQWADLKQHESTRSLDEAAYAKPMDFSFGSIHALMLHMLSAQQVWLQRFTGATPVWLADDARLSPREALWPEWLRVHRDFSDWLGHLDRKTLAKELRYTNLKGQPFAGPLWRFVTHALNHSTIHRAQLNSMIKLAGGSPPAVDYTCWFLSTQ
jgi:uncharacterized damage-inducible protein DinB